ncbi:hypothetical protein PTTG_04199 [Puccinia triticina 1-1 BBBD Race 1]|uniref:Uncharacterized protein n=1 Tax=Puccinia triticina (isolate 1-1 / race 1 (BBBD)) TaxID=630390 RepID=A0A180GEI2_PUCT1|nr:hypothetical protein PTTG_04199 [Puccinia triticina 1-1 BBBD Race 1]
MSTRNLDTQSADFHFQRTACSYASWIKTISSLAKDFLGPSPTEQWHCPDIIDLPLLSSFSNADGSLQPHKLISPHVKTQHPESTLVRFLFRLQNPPTSVTSEWAKIVAASVELMSENLYKPPPPITSADDDEITQGVQVLQYLDQLKNLSSTFETSTEDSTGTESQAIQRSHSVDVLHEFRNVIIDVFMGYIIFQTHALSKQPLTGAQRKNLSRATQSSSSNAATNSSVATTDKPTTQISRTKDSSTKQLQSIQSRQNFQPLIYYLVGGVRGLFIASRNHQNAPVSECISFIQAISIISQKSAANRTPEEPIWKNLSAYIVKLFEPAFQSPNKIVSLPKPPTRNELAQAITVDFLNHWRDKQPSSPFLIPHSSRQITEK